MQIQRKNTHGGLQDRFILINNGKHLWDICINISTLSSINNTPTKQIIYFGANFVFHCVIAMILLQDRTNLSNENRVTLILIGIVVMFLVCQSPTAFMLIYEIMTMHVEKDARTKRIILGKYK